MRIDRLAPALAPALALLLAACTPGEENERTGTGLGSLDGGSSSPTGTTDATDATTWSWRCSMCSEVSSTSVAMS